MRLLVLLVGTVLLSLVAVPTAQGAANEIRFCGGENRAGFQITAYSPEFPRTRCVFARATYRKAAVAVFRQRRAPRFRLRVRGQIVRCKYFRRADVGYQSITCQSPRRFVTAYRSR